MVETKRKRGEHGKQVWRKYLTPEGEKEFKELNNNEKAQVVFRVNKIASEHLEDLILIFESMHRITNNPDKQFRKILYEGDILTRFYTAFESSKRLAFYYHNRWLTPDSLIHLQAKLTLVGIEYDTKRLIEDKVYRLDKIEELKEEKS